MLRASVLMCRSYSEDSNAWVIAEVHVAHAEVQPWEENTILYLELSSGDEHTLYLQFPRLRTDTVSDARSTKCPFSRHEDAPAVFITRVVVHATENGRRAGGRNLVLFAMWVAHPSDSSMFQLEALVADSCSQLELFLKATLVTGQSHLVATWVRCCRLLIVCEMLCARIALRMSPVINRYCMVAGRSQGEHPQKSHRNMPRRCNRRSSSY
jgi:hypothetical protein